MRHPCWGRRNAGHGWPAAVSQTGMSPGPGSIPRPGRRCFRSPRTDRLQRSPPSLNKNAAGHDGPAAGTGTSRRRSGVDHGHPEGEVLFLARHVVHMRHRLRFGLRLADLEAAAERSEENTSELQAPMRKSYAVFRFKKKNKTQNKTIHTH